MSDRSEHEGDFIRNNLFEVDSDEPAAFRFGKYYINILLSETVFKLIVFGVAVATITLLFGAPLLAASAVYQHLSGHVFTIPTDRLVAVLSAIFVGFLTMAIICVSLVAGAAAFADIEDGNTEDGDSE